MKRSILILFCAAVTTIGHAQLLNGSFENALGGDMSYWTHTCIGQSAAGGAPSSGSWCAEVEAGNPQGCLPGMLYQVIPSAYDGMAFFLGGWCRNTDGPWAPNIGLAIGVMSAGGAITPMNISPATTDTIWTWLTINDTIHLAPNEQAVVMCMPGVVGGPAFALAQFDGLLFFETFPFSVEEEATLTSYQDVANGSLFLASNNARILGVRLLDLLGRTMYTNTERTNPTSVRVDISTLHPGVYFAAVRTDRGEKAVRFVVE